MSKPQENTDRDSILIIQNGVARIKEKGRLLVKDKGRQVAIFANGDAYSPAITDALMKAIL